MRIQRLGLGIWSLRRLAVHRFSHQAGKKGSVNGKCAVATNQASIETGVGLKTATLMSSSTSRQQNRREFVRGLARYAVLGILSVGALIAGRGSKGLAGRCVNRGVCSACGRLPLCGLPSALSTRQQQGKSARLSLSEWMKLRRARASGNRSEPAQEA